ncbi:MAG TPA: ATP-binding cassette domain-containing protein [Candidatus Ventrousia excrementavium]|uniref:ATP-binding cassette domain-containing protein n=1 Tax=Candidatus Ventrousia excrementavium TaxID=2840961 RepID=A0A9D1IXI9_9CLOT|nr:ATP-binding cassette domain-containing protein [Candidatus Ventrousia excrementavium]
MADKTGTPLIETRDLKKYFKVKKGMLHAVDGIDMKIMPGETFGVVGESGCGKSTLGRTLIRLYEPTGGEILYNGQDLAGLRGAERKKVQLEMAMIFQDPYSSLNPRMCVADLIADPMRVNGLYGDRDSRYQRVAQLMDTVGLARRVAGSYPHELDGGRRQRIGIARALALSPRFIICDEPVSALDVSIQAQILNLLMDLQDEMGLTYLFITHDLSVVEHISKNIMVTYLGKCVEMGDTDQIFDNPRHPYTKALFSALPEPTLEARYKKPQLLTGEVASPVNPGPGCRFAHRCPHATDKCREADVPLREVEPGHLVACCLELQ